MRKLNRHGKRRAIKGVKRSIKMTNIQEIKIDLLTRWQDLGKMTARSSSLHVAVREWPRAGLEVNKGKRPVMEE